MNRRLPATAAPTASNVVTSRAPPPPDFGGGVIVTEDVAVTAVSAAEMAVIVTVGELGTFDGAV